MRRLLMAFVLLALWGTCVDGAETPNIVLIMADDLGYGALGCYGQDKINTPHIDRLAADGMRFTQAYAGAAVCQPSRSVLMQGLHTGHSAVRQNDLDQLLLPEDVTIAELLQQEAYATGGFGKWGLGYRGTTGQPNRQGFDEWFGQYLQVHAHFYYPYWLWHNDEKSPLPGNDGHQRKQYAQDEIHAKAMAFIRHHADGPFFAYLPYIIPHVEMVVPEEWEEPYRGKFPKVPVLDPREDYIGSDDGFTTLAGMISRLDACVGEIRSLLDELEIADNTLVIFTSDNGAQSGGKDGGWTKMTDFFEGNGPFRGYKGMLYEGGIRVPFIVSWPGRTEPGSTSDHLCGFQDVLPTLCQIAGTDPPAKTDGISIVPTLTGEGTQETHPGLYWESRRRNRMSRAARMGQWKAVQRGLKQPIELYDLSTDMEETTNVAASHEDIVRQMSDFMDRSHEPERDYPAAVIDRPGIEDFVR